MSTISNVRQTANQLTTNYDVSKIFLGENERIVANYATTPGVTLANGLILGQVAATGALVAYDNTASDGSQFPIGVLDLGIVESTTIAAAGNKNLYIVNKGRVNESKLSFPDGIDLDSIISGDGRTVRQYMNAMGIIFDGAEELTGFDNN